MPEKNQPKCKTCDAGTLSRKTKYRYGAVLVAFGYVLLALAAVVAGVAYKAAGAIQFAPDSPDAGARVIGMLLGLSPFLASAGIATILGFFLCRTRKVLECGSCRVTLDAA